MDASPILIILVRSNLNRSKIVMPCNSKKRKTFVKENTLLVLLLFTFITLLSTIANAQLAEKSAEGLFDSDDVLTLRLSGEVRDLMRDRSDDMQYHPITMSYLDTDSATVSFPKIGRA